MGKLVTVLSSLALLVFIFSCAGSGSAEFPPMPPVLTDSSVTETGQGNHYLWGYYLFYVDPAKNIVQSIPLRMDAAIGMFSSSWSRDPARIVFRS